MKRHLAGASYNYLVRKAQFASSAGNAGDAEELISIKQVIPVQQRTRRIKCQNHAIVYVLVSV